MTDLRLALYQQDIPGNTGTILRLAACLGFAVDIIEPAGFDISDRNLKRSGMDYISSAALTRHVNFDRFEEWRATTRRRLILASTKASSPYTSFAFRPDEIPAFRVGFEPQFAGLALIGQMHHHAAARPLGDDVGRPAQPARRVDGSRPVGFLLIRGEPPAPDEFLRGVFGR